MNKEIKKKIRKIFRFRLNSKNRKNLRNKDITIISQNCIGGVILHDLGLQFKTPTINLFFSASDYIKFVKNLDYYLYLDFQEIETDYNYPVAKLGDLTLHLVHYHSVEEAEKKWKERVSRINWNNLYFIMADRDGATDYEISEFDNLPFKNKAFLTYKERPDIHSAYCIPNSKDVTDQIIDVCQYKGTFTGRRWIDDFDYVKFLNSNMEG